MPVAINVAQHASRIALETVLAVDHDITTAVDADVVVTDEPPTMPALQGRDPLVVVLAAASAAPCAAALRAVLAGDAAAALTSRDLESLPAVIAAVCRGVTCLGREVVTLAADLPLLDERRRAVLAALAEGATITAVARDLRLSVATIKRDVAALIDVFGVGSRVELVLEARRLGLIDGSD